jgi:putative component of membrane protein insertase Oxa1/YidC/SpoIIIJ protein YidD
MLWLPNACSVLWLVRNGILTNITLLISPSSDTCKFTEFCSYVNLDQMGIKRIISASLSACLSLCDFTMIVIKLSSKYNGTISSRHFIRVFLWYITPPFNNSCRLISLISQRWLQLKINKKGWEYVLTSKELHTRYGGTTPITIN